MKPVALCVVAIVMAVGSAQAQQFGKETSFYESDFCDTHSCTVALRNRVSVGEQVITDYYYRIKDSKNIFNVRRLPDNTVATMRVIAQDTSDGQLAIMESFFAWGLGAAPSDLIRKECLPLFNKNRMLQFNIAKRPNELFGCEYYTYSRPYGSFFYVTPYSTAGLPQDLGIVPVLPAPESPKPTKP